MIKNTHQLCTTLEQMQLMIQALEELRKEIPTVEPDRRLLLALSGEGPIDQLEEMRQEALEFARGLPPYEVSQDAPTEVESVS